VLPAEPEADEPARVNEARFAAAGADSQAMNARQHAAVFTPFDFGESAGD